jgi:hypothetical protein
MKAKRYKTKYKKGSTLGSLTWVGYDRESLLGYMKTVTDKGKEDPKNTEQKPNSKEDPNQ